MSLCAILNYRNIGSNDTTNFVYIDYAAVKVCNNYGFSLAAESFPKRIEAD